MNIQIREFKKEDIKEALYIWNEVVHEGVAFPQTEPLNEVTGLEFFLEQSFTGIAYIDSGSNSDLGSDSNSDSDSGTLPAAETIVGLYILHPNNIGRCGHICNASYAVRSDMRGQHIGEKLVTHCIEKGRELGFRILQFNAVVANNHRALHLYEKLGFVKLGVIPDGFLMKDGTYQDIVPHYLTL